MISKYLHTVSCDFTNQYLPTWGQVIEAVTMRKLFAFVDSLTEISYSTVSNVSHDGKSKRVLGWRCSAISPWGLKVNRWEVSSMTTSNLRYHEPSGVSLRFIPSLGFVVITPAGTTGWSGFASSISNAPTNVATRHLNSASAKFLPMQLLGPWRKVNWL